MATNFIFILADDLGYADLGCTGARDAQGKAANTSPRLDRMSAEGMRFTQGYSNSSVCSPTRFALITGRWQYRLRGGAEEPLSGPAGGDKVHGLPSTHPTLPSLLRDAGYATALVGKWHLGPAPDFGPLKSGYGEFFGYHSGGIDYFSHRNPRGKHDLWQGDDPVHRDGYLTDVLSDAAVDFVHRQTADKGFLLSLHYSAPHWPWLTRDDAELSPQLAPGLKHTDGGSLATYQRMIHHMDEGIGRVLDALEAKGLADDTLVVFTSDNGGERFSNNWPFVGEKMDLLEGGIRVPLIARWPRGMRSGSICTTPNLTMDWTATMLALAGVGEAPDYPLDGISLLPAFEDPQWSPQRDLAWRMTHRQQRALRRGDWKYLAMDGHEYLFNLAEDERERANRSARDPGRMDELREAWHQWNDSLPSIPSDAQVHLAFDETVLPKSTH